MNIANLRQRVICSFVLMFACNIPIHAQLQPPQSNQESGPTQDKAADQKMPGASAKGNIEILSDTQGVDFSPYLRRFKSDVQGKWYSMIPAIAQPPISKSGTAVIEFAIAKNGKVYGMKLVQSSGDSELDKAAWGGITDAIPLPALPSEFSGDYLRLRCSFVYNPAAASAMLKTSNKENLRPAITTRGTVEYVSDHEGLDGSYTKLVLDAVQSSLQNLLQKAPVPIKKSDQVAITFSILRNGAVKDIKLKKSSGNKSFDQAVWEAIQSSSPYRDLPGQFKGKRLKIRCEIDVA